MKVAAAVILALTVPALAKDRFTRECKLPAEGAVQVRSDDICPEYVSPCGAECNFSYWVYWWWNWSDPDVQPIPCEPGSERSPVCLQTVINQLKDCLCEQREMWEQACCECAAGPGGNQCRQEYEIKASNAFRNCILAAVKQINEECPCITNP